MYHSWYLILYAIPKIRTSSAILSNTRNRSFHTLRAPKHISWHNIDIFFPHAFIKISMAASTTKLSCHVAVRTQVMHNWHRTAISIVRHTAILPTFVSALLVFLFRHPGRFRSVDDRDDTLWSSLFRWFSLLTHRTPRRTGGKVLCQKHIWWRWRRLQLLQQRQWRRCGSAVAAGKKRVAGVCINLEGGLVLGPAEWILLFNSVVFSNIMLFPGGGRWSCISPDAWLWLLKGSYGGGGGGGRKSEKWGRFRNNNIHNNRRLEDAALTGQRSCHLSSNIMILLMMMHTLLTDL